jgi:hypothetical protein
MYYKENPYATLSYPQQSTSQDQYERLRHRDSSPLLPDGYVEMADNYYSSQEEQQPAEEDVAPGIITPTVKSYFANPWVMLALIVIVLVLIYYFFFSGTKESYGKTYGNRYHRGV